MNRQSVSILLLCAGLLSLCPPGSQAAPATQPTTAPNPLAMLEARMLYFPRHYTPQDIADFKERGGEELSFVTDSGKQLAFLIPPRGGGKRAQKLWVCCGGNAAVALSWQTFCRALPFPDDAYLLVDYPGYGACAGSPSPQSIRQTMKASILAAAERLKLDPKTLPDTVRLIGHSLGCSAALLAVEEVQLRSAVLCAPFTSTQEMATDVMGLPKGYAVQNRFDNRDGLRAIKEAGGHAWIIHGGHDQVIPLQMSRTLAKEFEGTVGLTVIENATHNDVVRLGEREVIAAMRAAREVAGAKK